MGTQPRVPEPPKQEAVTAGEEGADEALAPGFAPWWLLQTRRQRRLAVPVFLLAAGAALVASVVAHGAGRPGAASSAPSAVAGHPSPQEIDPNLPAECTHAISCISAEAVPAGTNEAISEFLAGARERVTYTVTQRNTDRLVYRAVNATSGDIELLVIVRAPEVVRSAATDSIDPSSGAAIRYVRRQVAHYEVQVQYTGPPGGTPPVELAVRLSQDPRLLEVG
ncbi:MAG: hypothetical protein M3N95_10465 [Actinomycetota bacterium]|nr:hypothetical protein [Actinomycetota bacterium]